MAVMSNPEREVIKARPSRQAAPLKLSRDAFRPDAGHEA
jgi:hypothetical protein